MSDESTLMELLQPNKPMTRRKMLRTMAAAGATTMAGGAILAACGDTQTKTPTQNVTIVLGDWPFAKLPNTASAKDLTDISVKSDVDMLKAFQKDNPTISYKYIGTKIDTVQKLSAAILADTAPTVYGATGNLAVQRAASSQGLAADISAAYVSHNVDGLLADYALPVWKNKYSVNGKYYGLPGDLLAAGAGIFYRRDQWLKMGNPEPKNDWTWDDFHNMAKAFAKPGKPTFQAPSYEAGYLINSNLLDPGDGSAIDSGLLGSLPVPGDNNWHWKVDITENWLSEWQDRVGFWRNLVYNEKIVEQGGTTYWEGSAIAGFVAEQYMMAPAFSFFYGFQGYGPGSIPDLAKKHNLTPSEVAGYLPYPRGSNGAYNTSINADINQVWINPNANATLQDKTIALWLYAWYGQGYVNKYAERYNASKDAKDAYSYPLPPNRFLHNPSLPADVTTEAAWGKPFIDVYTWIVKQPVIPSKGLFFPVDTQQGPNKAIHDDLMTQLTTTQTPVADIVKNFETQYNHLASGQGSDLDAATFKTSETNYLNALNTFFQNNLPTFYNGDWQKYYTAAQNALAGK